MPEIKQAPFAITNYKTWKEKGIVKLQKVGKVVIMIKEMWDGETGESIEPQCINLSAESIDKTITTISDHVKRMEDDLRLLVELKEDVVKLLEEN